MIRSATFDIIPPKGLLKEILESIYRYRAMCRKVFSACAMSEIAGSSVIIKKGNLSVKPNGKKAQRILKDAFGMDGKAHLYQARSWVLDENPTWMSRVWDSLRRDVSSRWSARDPEFTTARRGWLVMQGSRGLAFFRRVGIGIAAANLKKNALHEHKISLSWDNRIGDVEFTIPKLDGSRYYIWKCLRDGDVGWKIGTVYLNEKKRKGDRILVLTVSYQRPDFESCIDKRKVAHMVFNKNDQDNAITISGPDRYGSDVISMREAIGWLNELKSRSASYEVRRSAAGSPRKVWGSKKIWSNVQSRINTITNTRSNGMKYRNHLFTRRIVDTLRRWGCGTLAIHDVPEREIFEHPWNWFQFRAFVEYKMNENGGKVRYIVSEKKKAA